MYTSGAGTGEMLNTTATEQTTREGLEQETAREYAEVVLGKALRTIAELLVEAVFHPDLHSTALVSVALAVISSAACLSFQPAAS